MCCLQCTQYFFAEIVFGATCVFMNFNYDLNSHLQYMKKQYIARMDNHFRPLCCCWNEAFCVFVYMYNPPYEQKNPSLLKLCFFFLYMYNPPYVVQPPVFCIFIQMFYRISAQDSSSPTPLGLVVFKISFCYPQYFCW